MQLISGALERADITSDNNVLLQILWEFTFLCWNLTPNGIFQWLLFEPRMT